MKRSLSWSGLAIVAGMTACLGSSFVASGSGGAGASGGGSSTATTATGSSGCPVDEPVNGAPCGAGAPSSCSFQPYVCCQPDVAECKDLRWSVTPGTCVAMSCPGNMPVAGTACSCSSASTCVYTGECTGSGDKAQTASCVLGEWFVSTGACPTETTVTCGAATCTLATDVCVKTVVNSVTVYVGCAATDCPHDGYDCACARNVCPADHPICTSTDGRFVTCR
jgi:hypothetical protein